MRTQNWCALVGRLSFLVPLALLGACTIAPPLAFNPADIPPLKLDGKLVTVEDALRLESPDVLAVNDEMREFVREHTESSNNSHNTLTALHRAIKSPGALDMQYDPFADGDAQTVFQRGSGNCLSYAHMFVALAREAGLNARYQWMVVRPEWHRLGERVAVRLHVNVQVKMRDTTEYMVDIDPLNRNEVAGARLMDDSEGLALHHNNLAMTALAEERPEDAWMQVARGLAVAPNLSQLWVNLGAIYRYTGQYREAEQAYFHALEVDRFDRSAMNNLVVLYEVEGRNDEREYWLDRMRSYRERNPYYHANLGDVALQEQDWDEAYVHYKKARRLQPEDGAITYNLGIAAHRLGKSREAEKLVSKAIELAAFTVEKERYRIELRSIQKEQAASLSKPAEVLQFYR